MKYGKTYLFLPLAALLGITSCGSPDPSELPVITTPANAKVNLSQISLAVSNAKITQINEHQHSLSFDYTITNTAGAHLSFICIYSNTDELIETKLTDQEDQKLTLLSLIHISEPTRPERISYAVFCLKKKKQ